MTFLVSYWTLLGASLTWARQDVVPGSRFTSARGAALGDAFLPLGEDGLSALFYNPAIVGKFKKASFDAVTLQLHINNNYAAGIDQNFYNVINLPNFTSTLSNHVGDFMGVGAGLGTAFYTRGFAIGVLYQNQFLAAQDSNGNIQIKSLYQLIPAISTGIRLADGIFRLGYSVQWVNQAVGNNIVNPATTNFGYSVNIAQGSGFSHNLGVALTLPTTYLPSFNIVARNVLNTSYSSFSLIPFTTSSSGTPATDPMTLDASLSIEPKLGRGATLNMVFELRDITNQSNISLMGRAATGIELDFRNRFALRAGWGSGYPSLGIGVMSNKSQFSFSWYSEEIGTGYLNIRDIRYMVQFQVKAF